MKRLLVSLLTMLLPVPSPADADAWESDPIESKVGIHVIPNFGGDPVTFFPVISDDTVRSALQSVDWVNEFHQVVVVTSPGTSMEVGGSLNPDHGLSAVYRNRQENIEAVTKDAPETVEDMEAILVAFLKPGDIWKQVQEFEFWQRPHQA
jgi:hypothetical protein